MAVSDLMAIIGRLLPEPHAGLLSGIVFGTKASLSSELYDSLLASGTIHIVALSGMNITIMTNVLLAILLRFVSRSIACILVGALTIGFILFVGATPSVVRAGIMANLSLLSVLSGRQSWSLYGLILAVISMLLLNPLWLIDVSFQLSVLATLGILLFAKPTSGPYRQKSTAAPALLQDDISLWEQGVVSVLDAVKDDLRVTMAAQVFTLPLILFVFHRVSLIAPLTNILIGWIVAPVTVLGLIIALIGIVLPILAVPFAWIAWLLLSYMIFVIEITGRLPFASIQF